MGLDCGLGPVVVRDGPRPRQKWRPPLAIVIGASVAGLLVLPIFGFVVLRWVQPIFGWKVSVFWVSFAMLAAAVLIGAVQWRLLVRPIRELAHAAQDIADGKTSDPVPLRRYGTAELSELGTNVLNMAQDILDQNQALRGYADHVVHELKSPVTALRAGAELLELPNLTPDQLRMVSDDIINASLRIDALLDALRRHSESQANRASGQTPVSDLKLEGQGVRIFGRPVLPLDHDAALAVMTQLIENARQAGATRIDICETEKGLEIGDNGHGIETADLFRAFDPFFTTKRDCGGTGMGLSVVKTLLESGGATVSLWQKNGGAAVSIHP